jgi:mono/diheme cytochrome c family protein
MENSSDRIVSVTHHGSVATMLAIAALVCSAAVAGTDDQRYGIGRQATDAEIQPFDIDVAPSGEGLPPGRGTVSRGAEIYTKKCASCHGPTGVEGPADRLVGGHGSLRSHEPVKTVGSYWPYATTLYDYIYRAMPFTAPQSLTPEEVYSVVAWILARNGIVPDDAVIDAANLPRVRMPNHDGFVPDPRPGLPNVQE